MDFLTALCGLRQRVSIRTNATQVLLPARSTTVDVLRGVSRVLSSIRGHTAISKIILEIVGIGA